MELYRNKISRSPKNLCHSTFGCCDNKHRCVTCDIQSSFFLMCLHIVGEKPSRLLKRPHKWAMNRLWNSLQQKIRRFRHFSTCSNFALLLTPPHCSECSSHKTRKQYHSALHFPLFLLPKAQSQGVPRMGGRSRARNVSLWPSWKYRWGAVTNTDYEIEPFYIL